MTGCLSAWPSRSPEAACAGKPTCSDLVGEAAQDPDLEDRGGGAQRPGIGLRDGAAGTGGAIDAPDQQRGITRQRLELGDRLGEVECLIVGIHHRAAEVVDSEQTHQLAAGVMRLQLHEAMGWRCTRTGHDDGERERCHADDVGDNRVGERAAQGLMKPAIVVGSQAGTKCAVASAGVVFSPLASSLRIHASWSAAGPGGI